MYRICLSSHLLMDTELLPVASWLLFIVLLWTWVCKYLFEILLSIHIYIYTHTHTHTHPGVELLHHVVILFLIILGSVYIILYGGCTILYFHQQCTFISPLLNVTCYFLVFDSDHPDGFGVVLWFWFALP